MYRFINYIRSMRVSSLIFLAFLPFIIYAIIGSRNYVKAIKAILGIEENAGSLFVAFLFFISITFLGIYAAVNIFKFLRGQRRGWYKDPEKGLLGKSTPIKSIKFHSLFCFLTLK